MVSGEFVSMKSLHEKLPSNTTTPLAWGTYASNPNIHFFLCNFIEMSMDRSNTQNVSPALPDATNLSSALANLHKNVWSPNGKYGFSVPTLQGTFPQYTEWTDSWEDFFAKSMKLVMDNEEKSQGPDPEIQELCQAVLQKVIPRLLRPLETGGRKIKPRLIHGDIWDGNVAIDSKTGWSVIFDATCIYAHNEGELTLDFDLRRSDKNSRACAITSMSAQNETLLRSRVSQALSGL